MNQLPVLRDIIDQGARPAPFVIILDDLQRAGRHLALAGRHLDRGRLADAAREAEGGQRIAAELGLAGPASAALGILGKVAFHQGDLTAAEDYARSAELAAGGLRPAPPPPG
jgi:hypothetical protein